MVILLDRDTPVFSRELMRPWRLASLAAGIGLLIAGSRWLPSDDWDIPLCFVMALPTYVLAPWAFRQIYYFRWRWMLLAGVALWVTIDGTYSLYWWLRGFDALAVFRPANFYYCLGLFWICGVIWNFDFAKGKPKVEMRVMELRGMFSSILFRIPLALVTCFLMSGLVGLLLGFFRIVGESNEDGWFPVRIELSIPNVS